MCWAMKQRFREALLVAQGHTVPILSTQHPSHHLSPEREEATGSTWIGSYISKEGVPSPCKHEYGPHSGGTISFEASDLSSQETIKLGTPSYSDLKAGPGSEEGSHLSGSQAVVLWESKYALASFVGAPLLSWSRHQRLGKVIRS